MTLKSKPVPTSKSKSKRRQKAQVKGDKVNAIDQECAKKMAEKIRYAEMNQVPAPTTPYAYKQDQCDQAVSGLAGSTRRPSLREEAEKSVASHYEQAAKAERSAAFFREHPEFDEFIQLIRSGVIGI